MPAAPFLAPPPALAGNRLPQRLELAGMGAGFAIQGKDDVALRSTGRLIIGEAGDRLSQAARAGIRPQLGGAMENEGLQRTIPCGATVVGRRRKCSRPQRGRKTV